MRIEIDGELCTGHGRCYSLAPNVYSADVEGFNDKRGTEFDVPPGHEQAARLGIQVCPEGAISVVRAEGDAKSDRDGASDSA